MVEMLQMNRDTNSFCTFGDLFSGLFNFLIIRVAKAVPIPVKTRVGMSNIWK